MIDDKSLKLQSDEILKRAHDFEAVEFWQALVHHIASTIDHKMSTAEKSAKEFANVLLHETREADIVGNAKLARLELQAFLTQCFLMEHVSRHHNLSSQGK